MTGPRGEAGERGGRIAVVLLRRGEAGPDVAGPDVAGPRWRHGVRLTLDASTGYREDPMVQPEAQRRRGHPACVRHCVDVGAVLVAPHRGDLEDPVSESSCGDEQIDVEEEVPG